MEEGEDKHVFRKSLNMLINGTPVNCSQFYVLNTWRAPEARFL